MAGVSAIRAGNRARGARGADDRAWSAAAIEHLHREAARSADTHLLHMRFPAFPGIDFYFKDEAAHPTGSLKHRLARSLFLYALCNGRLREGQTVVDASSGSTAISEAWFARLLGLPFVAVMPAATSPEKIELIEFTGGRCNLVEDAAAVYAEARRIAAETGGHYLDQFANAERATDWRGNNNIAESIFEQMALERHPLPEWVVVGAGTGGTSATIGRWVRYRRLPTRLAKATSRCPKSPPARRAANTAGRKTPDPIGPSRAAAIRPRRDALHRAAHDTPPDSGEHLAIETFRGLPCLS